MDGLEDQAEVLEGFEFDPSEKPEIQKDEPIKDVILDSSEPTKVVKIGANLNEDIKINLAYLLKEYKDVFAWSHKDIPGIDTKVISHYLTVDPDLNW